MDLDAFNFRVTDLESMSLESTELDPMKLGFKEQVHTSSMDTGAQHNGVSCREPTVKGRGQRSKVLPEKEWARVRPIITNLYIDEERSHKEIQAIMATEHDFKAT
jgi:hypothetical protein